MRTHLGVRLLVAAAVSLLVSPPVLAQSLRQQLVNFGSPLGSEQGMAVLAALGTMRRLFPAFEIAAEDRVKLDFARFADRGRADKIMQRPAERVC